MKSSTIVAAAVMIGFVSVLIYRVSASDALGLGQLPMPVKPVDVVSTKTLPTAVEFIVQQCDIAGPGAIADADAIIEVSALEAPVEASPALPDIADQWVSAEGVPEFVLEDSPATRQAAAIPVSPSIIYIQ